MTIHKPKPPRKPLTPSDRAFHRQCQVAVINGIYAAYGGHILEAPQGAYETAIRAACRVAKDQADELLRADS